MTFVEKLYLSDGWAWVASTQTPPFLIGKTEYAGPFSGQQQLPGSRVIIKLVSTNK